ncbi:hypothetical protein UVI_02033010 [Ustilaginoidea virens]|uniref:SMODS and SLOG-associating 2TM effector domain-containing protein n=1 Tax=Ustilaginoidea virens TaxID=1159556 RepID=A0A1B5L591_USTVR|nr:hypothetical protein UVI_02033010 [Ustilaginoidea virens]
MAKTRATLRMATFPKHLQRIRQRHLIHTAFWPPIGMPPGLYREVVSHKYRFYYLFHLTSILRATLMILQLLIGAALTALGSMSLEDGRPITVLGAVNTVIAGLLALLHNSGLPDRYRSDMAGFEEIEDRIKEFLDSGIALVDQKPEQSTVTVNMPSNYASRQMLQSIQKNVAATHPAGAGSNSSPIKGPGGDSCS